jgi:hypothetical protein
MFDLIYITFKEEVCLALLHFTVIIAINFFAYFMTHRIKIARTSKIDVFYCRSLHLSDMEMGLKGGVTGR